MKLTTAKWEHYCKKGRDELNMAYTLRERDTVQWGSGGRDYEEYGLLGRDIVQLAHKLTFRRKKSPPSSESENKPRKKQAEKGSKLR